MRSSLVVLVAAGVALACGQQADVASSPPASAPVDLGGTYEVEGVTMEVGSQHERKIEGSVVLIQDGGSFTSSVSLNTLYPSEGGSLDAEVIGTGEGSIEGAKIAGNTDVQLVLSTVSGVDTQFAFVPRVVGPRIASTFTGEVAPDGSIELEIENQPAEGEDYRPTRTTLRGIRISKETRELDSEG